MTGVINGITVDFMMDYQYSGREVSIALMDNSQDVFRELLELCLLDRAGTGVQDISGSEPIGYDHTEDNLNTVYITFTNARKAKSGWYLLRGHSYPEERSVRGYNYYMEMSLFYLGNEADFTDGLLLKDLEELTNDWE